MIKKNIENLKKYLVQKILKCLDFIKKNQRSLQKN